MDTTRGRRISWLAVCVGGAALALLLRPGPTSAQSSVDVSVSQTGPATYTVGTQFAYTITVTIFLGGTTNVTLTDILPVGVSFVQTGSTPGCSDPGAGGTVTCYLTNVTGSTTVTIQAMPGSSAGNPIWNVVGVVGTGPDWNMSNNRSSFSSNRAGVSTPTRTRTPTRTKTSTPTVTRTFTRTATRTPTPTPAPAALSSLSLSPVNVPVGTDSTGTVTLTGPAPAGGALVTLSSSNNAIANPDPSVTVPANQTQATFTVSTFSQGSVTISGSYGGVTKTAGLTVTSPPQPAPPPAPTP